VEALAWALAWVLAWAEAWRVLAWAEAWVAPVSADPCIASANCTYFHSALSPSTFPPTRRRTRADWFLEQVHSSQAGSGRLVWAQVLAWA